MRIHALLSWYDESAMWLSAAITSLLPHVDHIVAVDGAYLLYPDGQPQSRVDQAHAIVETCHAAGVGLTLHRPQTKWIGNEVEKRNRLFALAERDAHPDDWYWVIDADELVANAPHDLRALLEQSEHDVAKVMLWERSDQYRDAESLAYLQETALPSDFHCPLRMLFRAIPGLRCDLAHYRYRTPDGRYLWNYPTEPMEDALDLLDLVRVEHRRFFRPKQRKIDARTYYMRRDDAMIEQKKLPA